jgi:NADP-dependent 3-hydroxy acid dehydrogenase YdfG
MKRTVLITGSSSGIGRATAFYFQQKGWNVAATMRSPEKETELNQLPNVICPKLDVTDINSIQQAVESTLQKFGKIDAVVNNAGYAVLGPFEAATQEQIQQQFDVNVFGVMNVTRAILPHFRAQKSGNIVNVASAASHIPVPLYSLYCGTKWAIAGYSEALQFELAPFNIRVKVIEPGAIKTDFMYRSLDQAKQEGLTAYDAFSENTMRKIYKFERQGAKPSKVARTIYRASKSRRYKVFYPTPFSAHAVLFLRRLLPGTWYRWATKVAVT